MSDARELAKQVLRTPLNHEAYGETQAKHTGYGFFPVFIDPALDEAASIIAAHDARLLDEAAERGVKCWESWEGRMPKVWADELRAAIKGAAHE